MSDRRDPFVVEEAALALTVGEPRKLPPPRSRELCVVGRSNVGKSSLINYLVDRKGLAHTSRTPGRTRLVNFFDVRVRCNQARPAEIYMVDLPGYGYAKLPGTEQQRVEQLLSGYLSSSRAQAAALQLIDCRREVEALDVEIHARLQGSGFRTVVAATKIDKLAKSHRQPVAHRLRAAFGDTPVVLTSAAERIGRADLWSELWNALAL